MSRRALLLTAALVLLVLALAALGWVTMSSRGGSIWHLGRPPAEGTNLALDIRYRYDSSRMAPGPYEHNAEFPFCLNSRDFSLYGKRIAGGGTMLERDPQTLLYSWTASLQAGAFEQWYGLKLVDEPVYEDIQLHGRLGLHQRLSYKLGDDKSRWPPWFPPSVTGIAPETDEASQAEQTAAPIAQDIAASPAETASVEGWVLYTDSDLFFFYAVSPQTLTQEQSADCLAVINSLEFNLLLGGSGAKAGAGSAPAAGGQSETPRGIREAPKAPIAPGTSDPAQPAPKQAPPAQVLQRAEPLVRTH